MRNTITTFIILGIAQGVAEFLPISSSGHLVILQQIPWIKNSIDSVANNQMLFINVALHLASLAAVIVFFRKDIVKLVTDSVSALFKKNFSDNSLIISTYIIIASIPAAIIGLLFSSYIEDNLMFLLPVSILLIINGLILLYTKRIKRKDRQLEQMGFFTAFLIGCCQAVAVLPGISRAGMTISGGMIRGIESDKAARFSFLMSIPVIAGAGLLESVKAFSRGLDSSFFIPLGVGSVACFVSALLALRLLFIIIRKTAFPVFGFYTIAVGLLGVAVNMFF